MGASKEDTNLANRWIRDWQKYAIGVRWDRWPASCSDVPKPRLGAHVHRDSCAEQKDLLVDIYHKS